MIYTVTLNPGLDRTLTVPAIREYEVLRASASRLDWGGKGFNVARALQAWGVANVAVGFVGGATGEMLARGLAGLGIATDFVSIEGETRTNTVIEEETGGRYIKVNEAGPQIANAAQDALLARVRALATSGSVWVLAGSLPPGVEIGFYARLATLVQARGGQVCLDASGEALRLGCAAEPYLVKPNAEEAQAATGRPVRSAAEAYEAAQVLLGRGVEMAAVSLGAAGLVLASGSQAVHARPPEVEARTVVGVGDVLLAGLLWAQQRGLELAEMARWGVAAGTAAAVQAGVSVPEAAAVETMAGRVAVETIF